MICAFRPWSNLSARSAHYRRQFGVIMQLIARLSSKLVRQVRGSVFVEYLLLATLVGIGVIAGLGTVRLALLNELQDLANAISAINSGS